MTPRELVTARRADALIAAGLLVWAIPDVPGWWKPPTHVAATPVIAGYLVLALAMSVPFLWRRRLPVAVLVLTAGVLVIRSALAQNAVAAFAAVLMAAYGLGAFGARRYARPLGRLLLGVAAAIALTLFSHRMAAVPFALIGAACLVGDAATARRNEVASAVRAAHLAERNGLARELHDVLAHQLSAITLQAGTARLTGAEPARALATIEGLGREALTELDHVLGVLRRDGDSGPALRPAPSLAGLGDLVAAAGDTVRLSVAGRVRDLTPGLELSAYRIVQESLTNVARHAPGAEATVTLTYLDDHLVLEIVNGPSARAGGPQSPGGSVRRVGRGLPGMCERTALYGGELQAAATPDGFKVTATLPYTAQAGRR
jgi:signal transduction histidine kinase